ncbi:ADP-heptose:LPS heptosyltransferase [Vreelandella subterranea]|uniref:ADP-heptose:LPS heptosyltransferase n=1 Tax=Vreelandella subterranea TaxID=416874 RepID=A0A1H9Q5S0_9GAMM|nr:glycosyltransferase family 9 protein [Halomonas subterranea]SER55475.1 ADP-heptose:LPS heptosyltransferase [Halomonas subterranea]
MTQKILVIRNDKIGDFMLAWPALAYLKNASPTPHVTVLVPSYTAPLAKACPWVDEVIIDPGSSAAPSAQHVLLEQIKAARFDALLTLFSTPRIGWLGWRAGIRLRVAPATKWAQIFYNLRIKQRRSRSTKPEYQYNVDLALALIDKLSLTRPAMLLPPYWPLDTRQREYQRKVLLENVQAKEGLLIVVHPGSGGSAVNLSLDQYVDLVVQIHHISKIQPIHWLISAGPSEHPQAQELIRLLANKGVVATHFPTRSSVEAYALQLAGTDMLIAGSTGPLHIAGCLNIATAGFYPAKRSATSLRWQTCNSAEKRLNFSSFSSAPEKNMLTVDIDSAAKDISLFLSKH